MIYTPEKIYYIKWKFAQSNKFCFVFLAYIAFYKIIYKIKKTLQLSLVICLGD